MSTPAALTTKKTLNLRRISTGSSEDNDAASRSIGKTQKKGKGSYESYPAASGHRAGKGVDGDLDLVRNAEKKLAGILEAPLHVGNRELEGEGDAVSLSPGLHVKSGLVVCAMKAEEAVHGDAKIALRRNLALDTLGEKDDLGEFLRFEDFPVHVVVAILVAALSTGGVDDDLSAGFAGGRFEQDAATLERKGPMNGVKRRAEREIHLSLARIEFEGELLGAQGRSGQGKEETKEAENAWGEGGHMPQLVPHRSRQFAPFSI